MQNFRNLLVVFYVFALLLTDAYSNDDDIQKYEGVIKRILQHKKGVFKLTGVYAKEQFKTHLKPKQVFEIESNGKHYIFRKFSQKNSTKRKVKEIQMAQIVSQAGFGPRFIGAPHNNEFYIVEFAGCALTYNDLSDEMLRNIGKTIRKMHDFKFAEKGRSQCDRLKKHYKRCLRKRIALPSGFKNAYDDYIKHNDETDSQLGFCHGNLNPSNIRINEDKEITFINWKNAGNGDVYEDIGYFILTNGLNDDQVSIFMEGYLGRAPNSNDINKAKNAANKTCLLTASVWFEFSEDANDKKIPLKTRISILDGMTNSDKIRDVFEYPRTSEVPYIFSKNKGDIKQYAISAWAQYNNTLAPKLGCFARFKEWLKNLLN